MAEHVYVVDGGYFYKTRPLIALPPEQPVDLFGNPVGPVKTSPRQIAQLHGIYRAKEKEARGGYILLHVTGRITIVDDVLDEGETRELESHIKIYVPDKIFAFPFQPGRKYLITHDNVKQL